MDDKCGFSRQLSNEDAGVLAAYCSMSRVAVEIGGGETAEIMARALPPEGHLYSFVDTSVKPRIAGHLKHAGVEGRVTVMPVTELSRPSHLFSADIALIDGTDFTRRGIAPTLWDSIRTGGHLLVHDTRRSEDFTDIISFLGQSYSEIREILINRTFNGVPSNITVVTRKIREPIVASRVPDRRPDWMRTPAERLEQIHGSFVSSMPTELDGHITCDWIATAAAERRMSDEIIQQRRYRYMRIGYDERPMEFLECGRIGTGSAQLERLWDVVADGDSIWLRIHGDHGMICKLQRQSSGAFRGRWTRHEKMMVMLVPVME